MDLSYKWQVRAGGKDVSRPSGHLLPLLVRLLHVLLRDAGGEDGPEVLSGHGHDLLRPVHIPLRARLRCQHSQPGLLYQYSGKLMKRYLAKGRQQSESKKARKRKNAIRKFYFRLSRGRSKRLAGQAW